MAECLIGILMSIINPRESPPSIVCILTGFFISVACLVVIIHLKKCFHSISFHFYSPSITTYYFNYHIIVGKYASIQIAHNNVDTLEKLNTHDKVKLSKQI